MSRLERPICANCRREMECVRNGFLVTSENEAKAWQADLYGCPGCDCAVVVGSGEGSAPNSAEVLACQRGKHGLRLKEGS